MEEIIDLGDGITMRPASRADLHAVDRDLRDFDRKECELAHDFAAEPDDYPEGVWTFLHNGKHIGYGGFLCIKGETALSRRRCLFFLSTNHVNEMKKLFVKKTMDAFREIANRMPPYVDTVVVAPMKEYVGSVRWLEKVLGFKKRCETVVGGATYVIMEKRKGV